jgi:ATP-dependent protease Clp ATPase subunit
MNAIVIRKAERRKAKLRLALIGPTGSGKTFSALQLAFGLGGKSA